MFDQILFSLKQQAAPELMAKLGLNDGQATQSVGAAVDSMKQVLGGADGFGMDDVLNLFSSAQNNSAADGILSQVGSVLQGKLTDQVGLEAAKAGGVKDMLLPMITDLIGKYVNGDGGKLQDLLGGLAGGGNLGNMAKNLLGGLFK
ncbi:MAG: hypothetical protein KDB93_02705 [Flavobacteriales bacterium]|nr:hypothetical protein [Flavobacteriales bacterium]